MELALQDLLSELPAELLLESLIQAQLDDERLVCEGSLYEYLVRAWPQFDPAPFVGNWHLRAIAEHLEAVSRGEIRRLIINIPPRMSKTSIVSIAWPTWTWAKQTDPAYPLLGPGVRFLCASYGAKKAEEDAVTARRLIASNWWQHRWGQHCQIAKDRDNAGQYDTVPGGSRISTGIPESLGKGGIIRICFPWDTGLLTDHGFLPIGMVVEDRSAVWVPSLNEASGCIETKPVVGWHRNPGAEIRRLTLSNGFILRCTADHMLRVAGGQWKAAGEIPIGTAWEVARPADLRKVGSPLWPIAPGSDFRHDADADPEVSCSGAVMEWREENTSRQFLGHFEVGMGVPFPIVAGVGEGSVFSGVIDILRSGPIAQITKTSIGSVSVSVPDFHTVRDGADECSHHELMDMDVVGFPFFAEADTRVSFAQGGSEQSLPNVSEASAVVVGDSAGTRFDSALVGNEVIGEVVGNEPMFVWLVGNDFDHFADVTYCVTVADNHNMFVGNENTIVCAANCDDPHKTTEVESQAVVEGQVRAYNEVWRTRSNDPNQGAEVLIMQRQAEGDLSGYLLDNEGGEIVHLFLPAEFESGRRCVTAMGGHWLNAWGEPIGETEYEFADPREEDGEPLWPERFDTEWCRSQQRSVGEFAWAGQFQQRPAPRGGGIIRREWWEPWPPEGEEDRYRRAVVDVVSGVTRYVMAWPAWEYTCGYVDTAFTEKEENAWCAMTTWGVFADSGGRPKVAMTGAWRERPTLQALGLRILDTARRRRLDVVVIENKAGAEWVKQELARLMAPGEFLIVLDDVKGDKVARLHSVSPLFEGGVVHAPDTTWAEMVIAEVSQFPKGRWKDLTDTVSGSLGYLRRSHLIKLADEHERDEQELRKWRGRRESVASLYGVG